MRIFVSSRFLSWKFEAEIVYPFPSSWIVKCIRKLLVITELGSVLPSGQTFNQRSETMSWLDEAGTRGAKTWHTL